jgi:lysozyme
MIREINDKGLKIVKDFEGVSLTPYLCPANVYTIGIGTTVYPNGTKVKKEDPPITLDQALIYLKHDLKYFCDRVDSFCQKNSIYLGDNKFSAIVSFCYNVGLGPLTTKGKLMHDGLITNDEDKIKKAFLAYTKVTKIQKGVAKKIELPGLVKRRKAEMELFFSKS